MDKPSTYADLLNKECRCTTLDANILEEKLSGLILERPNLFSQTTTYLDLEDFNIIQRFIRLIEKVIWHGDFQVNVFPKGKGVNSSAGVLMGYDFHLTEDGPRLIEINTNAGGAYLNLILAQSQIKCCEEKNLFFNEEKKLQDLNHKFMDMFLNEWVLQRPNEKLQTIVITDENPADQYLYPEFILFRELFIQHGYRAFILDPSEIDEKEDGLYFNEIKIDLIYNRLTDFALAEEKHSHLRRKWIQDKLVLTPDPDHHALFASKKNLSFFSNQSFLKKLGLTDTEIESIIRMIPETRVVKTCDQTSLWEQRKKLFFKPVDGFGSKATYRGDKITHKVWNDILSGEYVAQGLIPPGKRVIAGKETALKMDIRAYTYEGNILLMAARLYEGQTTNFRTAGGGFSPIFVVGIKDS